MADVCSGISLCMLTLNPGVGNCPVITYADLSKVDQVS